MGGPFFQFDLPGTRRIVDAVRRVERTPNFDASHHAGQYQGDAVLMPMQVVSIPATNSNYVITQPYSFNGSQSNVAPYNYSVAAISGHAVGDLLYAIPVGCSLQQLTDENGSPVLLQEVGSGGAVQFVVGALPAMSGGVVKPYVVGKVYSSTSTGTQNVSIGVIQAHDVGDTLFAIPVSQITAGGTVLRDAGGSPVMWMEAGNYGLTFECGLSRSGGSNGSSGTNNTLSYIITTKAGVPLITTPQQPDAPPYVSQRTVVAATKGLACISNHGNWYLVQAFDWNTGVQCPSSGGGSSEGS